MSLSVQRFFSHEKPAQGTKTPANLHRPLYIEKVDPKDYPLIQQILNDWQTIAKTKLDQTNRHNERHPYEQLRASASLARATETFLSEPHQVLEEFFVCRDESSGKVYGIASGYNNRLEICGGLLLTHPNNIQCKANRSELHRVKGVGTAFMKLAEAECQKQGKAFEFSPSSSAVPFYRKFGYVKKNNFKKYFPKSKL